MIVVDTNVIAYLYLEGEYSNQVEILLQQDPVWAAPILWRSEFRNVLASYLRQKIIRLRDALFIIEKAEKLLAGNEYNISSESVLKLALDSGCSAYDCEFVSLAQVLEVPLVTADAKILNKFPKHCVSLKSFATH